MGVASSNPNGERPLMAVTEARDGDAAPSDQATEWDVLEADWRYWFARAHIAWARRHAPWLLERWLDV